MNDYTKDMVSDADRAEMDKEDYVKIIEKAWSVGYYPADDTAYNGEERWCK